MKAFLVLMLLFGGNLARAAAPEWVSLYSSQERNFSNRERRRIKTRLLGFGVEYKNTKTRDILVPKKIRSQVKKLLAESFLHGSLNQKSNGEIPNNLQTVD